MDLTTRADGWAYLLCHNEKLLGTLELLDWVWFIEQENGEENVWNLERQPSPGMSHWHRVHDQDGLSWELPWKPGLWQDND